MEQIFAATQAATSGESCRFEAYGMTKLIIDVSTEANPETGLSDDEHAVLYEQYPDGSYEKAKDDGAQVMLTTVQPSQWVMLGGSYELRKSTTKKETGAGYEFV